MTYTRSLPLKMKRSAIGSFQRRLPLRLLPIAAFHFASRCIGITSKACSAPSSVGTYTVLSFAIAADLMTAPHSYFQIRLPPSASSA